MTLIGIQSLVIVIIAVLSVMTIVFWDYFKHILHTPIENLNWIDKILCWIIVWPYLIAYLPYKITLWMKDRKEERNNMEKNLNEWKERRRNNPEK